MKRLSVILLVVILLAGCHIVNEEGFELFRYADFIYDGIVCVQTHDGFEANGIFYTEKILDTPVTVDNILDYDIQIKVTDTDGSKWFLLPANSSITF